MSTRDKADGAIKKELNLFRPLIDARQVTHGSTEVRITIAVTSSTTTKTDRALRQATLSGSPFLSESPTSLPSQHI